MAQVSPGGAVSRRRAYNRLQSWPSRDIAIDLIGRHTRDSGSRTPESTLYLLCTSRTGPNARGCPGCKATPSQNRRRCRGCRFTARAREVDRGRRVCAAVSSPPRVPRVPRCIQSRSSRLTSRRRPRRSAPSSSRQQPWPRSATRRDPSARCRPGPCTRRLPARPLQKAAVQPVYYNIL